MLLIAKIKHKQIIGFASVLAIYCTILLLPVPQSVDGQLYSLYVNVEKHGVRNIVLEKVALNACADGYITGYDKMIISNKMNDTIDLIIKSKDGFTYQATKESKAFCSLFKNKKLSE